MSENFLDEIKKTRVSKTRASYNIENDVLKEFNKISKTKKYNKSQIINNFLKKLVEQEKSLM